MTQQKQWAILAPLTVGSPKDFTRCDMIEVRVQITPLSWVEAYDEKATEKRLQQSGDAIYSQYQIVRIEAQDHRALFHITKELLWNLFVRYLGVER